MCKTLPLELKTGRPSGSAEHRGQLILYSMMMSERRPDPEAGLLLYLRTSSMQEIKAGIHEMRGLVQLRNQLAFHLANDNEVHIHIFNCPYYTQVFFENKFFFIADIPFFCSCFGLYFKKISVYIDFSIVHIVQKNCRKMEYLQQQD